MDVSLLLHHYINKNICDNLLRLIVNKNDKNREYFLYIIPTMKFQLMFLLRRKILSNSRIMTCDLVSFTRMLGIVLLRSFCSSIRI